MGKVLSLPDVIVETHMPEYPGDKRPDRVLILSMRAHASLSELLPPWVRWPRPRGLFLSTRNLIYLCRHARKLGLDVRERRPYRPRPSYAYLHAPVEWE